MGSDAYTQLGLRGFPRVLAREAKKAAAHREMTLTEFVAFAVRQTLGNARGEGPDVALERDLLWYETHRDELARRYHAGTSIAIVDEEVVDHDKDTVRLSRRLHERYGRRSIVMPRLGDAPRAVAHLRSPRRV